VNQKWAEMSLNSFRAAQMLHSNAFYRSAISRAYYAIYAAIVAELTTVKGIHFAYQGSNPTHDSLPKMIGNLDSRRYSWTWKKRTLSTFNALRQARIMADYGAFKHIDVELSRRCLLLGNELIKTLVSEEEK